MYNVCIEQKKTECLFDGNGGYTEVETISKIDLSFESWADMIITIDRIIANGKNVIASIWKEDKV